MTSKVRGILIVPSDIRSSGRSAIQRAQLALSLARELRPAKLPSCMLFVTVAGFGMAASAGQSWTHLVLFAGTLTLALYIMTDMEYPRLGLIRIENFDHFLDVYDQMR